MATVIWISLRSTHPIGREERLVWFANDGRGVFGKAVEVQVAAGGALRWRGQASGLAVTNDDQDGWLDILVASPAVHRFAGGAEGFAAAPVAIGGTSDAGMVAVPPRGEQPWRLVTVTNGRLVEHRRDGGMFVVARDLGAVEGDSGQVRLALIEPTADGASELLVGETLSASVKAAAPMAPARRVVAAIEAELAELNRSRPPVDDAAAMAERQARRADLERFAAAPQQVLAELGAVPAPQGNEARLRPVRLH